MNERSGMLAGWRVVVADDEQFIRTLVMRMIRDLGCEDVQGACNGREAMEQLRGGNPCRVMLLSDFGMPDTDGLSAVKLIRTGKAGCRNDTPVVMLTGHADSGLVTAAMSLDIDGFLIKPVSVDKLAARLLHIRDEPRVVDAADSYEHVDVQAIRDRIIRREPLGKVRPPTAKPIAPKVMQLRLHEIRPGQVLAADVKTPAGECLLAAGVTLNERHLRRLGELSDLIGLQFVSIVATP